MNAFPHPDVLEEPRTHDAGGVLGQNAPLGLRRVFVLTQEAEVLVQLQLKLGTHTQSGLEKREVWGKGVCKVKMNVFTYKISTSQR